jgi:hypothetical protein
MLRIIGDISILRGSVSAGMAGFSGLQNSKKFTRNTYQT